jgi:hypothetical protein
VRARRDTHASTTDPEARLYRKGKGKEAKLSYVGNALTENRHGLVVEAELGTATGTIEREAPEVMDKEEWLRNRGQPNPPPGAQSPAEAPFPTDEKPH